MRISMHDLKEAMYIVQTMFGFILLALGIHTLQMGKSSGDFATALITGVVLAIVGVGCLFFGLETYILKDEEDIWR
jgi:hypothetical protein